MPDIYTVTTVQRSDQKGGPSPRMVGWFPDLDTAWHCVLENWGDIHENSYSYAVIERVPAGLYPSSSEEHWFEWDEYCYHPSGKPLEFCNIRGFGIG